ARSACNEARHFLEHPLAPVVKDRAVAAALKAKRPDRLARRPHPRPLQKPSRGGLSQDSLHRSNEVEAVDRPILGADAQKDAFLGGIDGDVAGYVSEYGDQPLSHEIARPGRAVHDEGTWSQ